MFRKLIELIPELSDDTTYMPLGKLIRQTEHCKCSAPRETIFALLSILESEQDIGIRPDYSSSISEV